MQRFAYPVTVYGCGHAGRPSQNDTPRATGPARWIRVAELRGAPASAARGTCPQCPAGAGLETGGEAAGGALAA